jgi:hypothetical protein
MVVTSLFSTYGGIPQELNRITFVNETGHSLYRLFWAPSYQSDTHFQWGNNLIPYGKTLNQGEISRFFVHYPESCTFLDFWAIDHRGNQYISSRIQVCNQEEQVVFLEPTHRIQRTIDFEEVLVDFIHDGQVEVWFLFLSPQSFGMWGADVLGDTLLLGPGQQRRFAFPRLRRSDIGLFLDVMAVDSRDRVYIKKVSINSDSPRHIIHFSELSVP